MRVWRKCNKKLDDLACQMVRKITCRSILFLKILIDSFKVDIWIFIDAVELEI